MKYQTQLMLIEKFASRLLRRALLPELRYHDYQHTLDVVAAAEEIGRASGLTEEEVQLVQMAAWLHDVGHVSSYTDHETESKSIALELLCLAGMEEWEIALILGCIEATRMPQTPQNHLEEVLCDADLAHLSKSSFIDRSELLRQEWADILGHDYTDDGWLQNSYEFLIKHRYFTPYGREILRPRKADNVCALLSLGHLLAA